MVSALPVTKMAALPILLFITLLLHFGSTNTSNSNEFSNVIEMYEGKLIKCESENLVYIIKNHTKLAVIYVEIMRKFSDFWQLTINLIYL